MMLKRNVFILLSLFIIFSSCVSTSGGLNPDGVSYGSSPAWVSDVYSVYNRAQYVAATGYGSSRSAAEGNALAAVTSFFGQTVQVERNAASYYKQAIVNGVMESWIDTAEMRSNINTTAVLDNLMGVEIEEVWYNSRDTYYAVAVMEKAKTVRIYTDLIRANLNVIQNLVSMTPNERSSLDGVIRYRFAAAVADVNISYRNIVALLGGNAPAIGHNGDYYRLEAQNIIKIIPVNVPVTNDRNSRIFGAFAKCFTDLGFEVSRAERGSNSNSRYVLDVNAALSPVNLPGNPGYFVRIELSANLTDTLNNIVLFPYNFNIREGHVSLSEAEVRAIAEAERNISENYSTLLSEYLTSLMPKK